MSAEGSFGLNLAEKFFGFILLLIGFVGLYYTLTSSGALLAFTGFFAFLCIIVVVLGFVMLAAKTE
jgi:membrane-bound ClpP family serine protease